MNPLLITHAEDPDGIISRALLMRALFIDDKDLHDHVFVRYDRLPEAFQEAVKKAKNHDSVYVADISLNDRLLHAESGRPSLLDQAVAGKEAHWFDHHDGTVMHQKELSALGIDMHHHQDHCASVLVAKHFFLGHPYEQKLVQVAQANDYRSPVHEPDLVRLGKDLEKIIALINEKPDYDLLLDLACAMRDEQCFDRQQRLLPPWQELAAEFSRRESDAYAELDQSAEMISVGVQKIIFGHASPLLAPKQGPNYLREQYREVADIFVCLFKPPVRNHLVFICEDASFPVVPFVQGLGGGGRGTGGGFTLPYDVTPENYERVKEMLLDEIEKYCLP